MVAFITLTSVAVLWRKRRITMSRCWSGPEAALAGCRMAVFDV
jgi:hypothetical protein